MKIKWKTEKRKIDDIVPYEKNPRQIIENDLFLFSD